MVQKNVALSCSYQLPDNSNWLSYTAGIWNLLQYERGTFLSCGMHMLHCTAHQRNASFDSRIQYGCPRLVQTENWDNAVHTMSRLQAVQSVVQNLARERNFSLLQHVQTCPGATQPLFNGYQDMKLTTHLYLLLAKDLKQVELYSTPSMYLHTIDRGSFSFLTHIIIKQVLQTQSKKNLYTQ